MFMAGGGIKGGHTHDTTDDLGYEAVVDKLHVRDLHATMLHQLDLDHMRLSAQKRYQDGIVAKLDVGSQSWGLPNVCQVLDGHQFA